jgi:hypothetical protein
MEAIRIKERDVEKMAENVPVPCRMLFLLRLSPKGVFRLYI